jgi:RNA polymerase sigma-70 factor, ECF subfamily
LDESDDILRQCRDGSEAACAAMIRCFQARIFRLALRVTGDAARADDATAAVLVKLWTTAARWKGESSARTWVDRVAVRTLLDEMRGHRRWWRRWARTSIVETVDIRPDAAEGAERAEEQGQIAARIRAAVAELEPADRALVHLYYFEGRSLAELEVILAVGRDGLKMRLARARKKLKVILSADDHAE